MMGFQPAIRIDIPITIRRRIRRRIGRICRNLCPSRRVRRVPYDAHRTPTCLDDIAVLITCRGRRQMILVPLAAFDAEPCLGHRHALLMLER